MTESINESGQVEKFHSGYRGGLSSFTVLEAALLDLLTCVVNEPIH